ncbi:vomeronasal type-2 receptor 26-like [Ascaphus truei]|uniref:vomeronasal type-2 receptor 26-like n=1 Tax=Ascaphus truei TaxID=8439 RepID=UPI003F590C23
MTQLSTFSAVDNMTYSNNPAPLSVCSSSCLSGFRKATLRGKPVCCFQCVLCPRGEISNQTDSVYCSKCPWDMWPNLQRDKCLPKSREFLSYEEPLGVTLAVTSVCSSLFPVFMFALFINFKTTPIVRANNYTLSCLLLLSLSLCFLCSLAFIGFPQPEKCLLRQVAFGMVFALCISCILAKTIMVVFAFKATKPGSNLRKWTSNRVSYLIVILCILIQTFLCIFWLSFSPPFPELNTQTKSEVIIVECNEGSHIVFWGMLGYLGLLATVSFIVAFLARQLPDSFNEAKFITFSMLAFLSVWVSYIPASLSARGKYTVAMEIFAILSSSWALVVCMFVPKCFIILFRPNMNSREHLMGKDRDQTHKTHLTQHCTSAKIRGIGLNQELLVIVRCCNDRSAYQDSLESTLPAQRGSDGEHRSGLSFVPNTENSTQEGDAPRKDGGEPRKDGGEPRNEGGKPRRDGDNEWETIRNKNSTVQTSSAGKKTAKTGDKETVQEEISLHNTYKVLEENSWGEKVDDEDPDMSDSQTSQQSGSIQDIEMARPSNKRNVPSESPPGRKKMVKKKK